VIKISGGFASRRSDLREALALEEERQLEVRDDPAERRRTVKLVEKLAKGYSR
jgi:hypothetical protein